jgi:hypothetical protein
MVNEEVIVTGGVEPYGISIDTTGNVKTVTVVDFDGCESTAQYAITNVSEKDIERIKLYPNPASTAIHIDLTGTSNPIAFMRLISINGQVLKHFVKTDRILDISTLVEGVYVLQVELEDGVQMNERVLIFR